MAASNSRAAWAAWRSFAGTPVETRAFLAARLAIAPLRAMDAELRALRGSVLSLGCGYGIIERYVAEINPHVRIVGLELDEERVRVATETAPAHGRVLVNHADVTRIEGGMAYDGALVIDVLHHLTPHGQRAVAAALALRLAGGGTCLVKEIATRPRWQHAFNRLHDRIVAGSEPTYCRAPAELARVFAEAGFRPAAGRRLSRAGPYPHYLLTLERSASAGSANA